MTADGARRAPLQLLFLFRNVGSEVFFASAQRRHETDAVLLFHHTAPAILVDVPPAVEMFGRAGLWIAFSRKKEELHFFLHHPDLRDALAFLIVKNAAAEGFQ